MAVQINWALAAQQPDFAGNALKGYQEGQQVAQQTQTRNALQQYRTDPQGAISALTSVDPVAASQLRQAYTQDEALKRQQVFRDALGKGDMGGAVRAAAGDPALMQSLSAVQSHMKSLNDAQAAGLQSVAGIKDPVERARVWDSTVAPGLVQLGMDPNAVSSKSGALDFSDEGIKAAVGKTMTAKEQIDNGFKAADLDVKKGQMAETGRHNQATEANQAGTLQETSRHNQQSEKTAAVSANAAASNAATNAKKLTLMQNGGGMDPDVIEFYAQRNATDGFLPTLGMGPAAAGIKANILARSAQLQRGEGQTGADAAVTVAGAKGNAKALGNLSSQGATVKTAEQAASQAADLALQLGVKGAGPGQKWINKPIQYIRSQVSDPDAAAFNDALGTFRDEAAKVLGGGQSTDALRHEVDSRINGAQSLPELQRVIATTKQLMAARSKAYDDQQASLRGQIKGGSKAQPAPAADRPSLDSIFGKH